MLVYVLNNKGNPLMPCDCRKARKLLKSNKAKCVKKEPFTKKGEKPTPLGVGWIA